MPSRYEKIKDFVTSTEKILATGQTLEDIFSLSMDRRPHGKALTSFDDSNKKHTIRYSDYKSEVFLTASKFSSAFSALPAGCLVALKMKNSPRWCIFFWAILMSGHPLLLLDAKLPVENAENLLSQSQAKAIISNEETQFSVPSFRVNSIMNQEADYDFRPTWANQVTFCSSGTTGEAKMMIYDGKAICHQLNASHDMYKTSQTILVPEASNLLAMIPFHHIFGFTAVFLWYTYYGKNIVFPSSLATSDIMHAVHKGHVTHLYAVPLFWDSLAQQTSRKVALAGGKKLEILKKMVAYNTQKISKKEAGVASYPCLIHLFQRKILGSQIRYCISGGGYLSLKTATAINGIGYPLYNGYGMTEIGVTSVELSPSVEQRLKGSIGKPLYGVSYRIDPTAKDEPDLGELLVKSPYLHEKECVGGKIRPTPLEDGYYRTGDIAFRDAQGSYYIKGRIKDTIILSNGENVFPDEIEDYFQDVRHVNNCVVLGAKDGGKGEEKIILVIEVDNSATSDDLRQIKSDIASINSTLANEKKIQKILVAKKPLPMANNLKVKRFLIKQGIEAGSADFLDLEEERHATAYTGYDPSEVAEVSKKVIKEFSKVLLLPEFKIDGGSHWIDDLGGDSMSYIEMAQNLNKTFKVTIPESLYGNLVCADDFVKEIIDLRHANKKPAKKKGSSSAK